MGVFGDAYDAVAGAADYAAGSTDEAVYRTFDDESGGGIADGTYETAATTGDVLSGHIDESVARTFDDEEGGGLIDGAVNTADNLTSPITGTVGYLGRGVGGLYSLVDNQPGNTAGPGQQSWDTAEQAAENGYLGSANIQRTIIMAVAAIAGIFALRSILSGIGEGLVA